MIFDSHTNDCTIAFASEHDSRSLLAVLGCVREEIAEHLRQAIRVSIHGGTALRYLYIKVIPALFKKRTGEFPRTENNATEFNRFLLKIEVSSRNPGDIEKVVDHATQMVHLPLENSKLSCLIASQPHELQSREHRRKQVPQLVAEHRQENVLCAVGALRLVPYRRQSRLCCLSRRDVAEQNSDTVLCRIADSKGVDVVPASERRRFVFEAHRLPGERHTAVSLEPMLFMRRRQFAHSATCGVLQAGLLFECLVDVKEPVVRRVAVAVEENLYGAEPLIDPLK